MEPPKNPDSSPAALIERGRNVSRETCINCHVPPSYTSGKLTLAQAYTPSSESSKPSGHRDLSVGTEPGLATKTRKGTGFIRSLRTVVIGIVHFCCTTVQSRASKKCSILTGSSRITCLEDGWGPACQSARFQVIRSG